MNYILERLFLIMLIYQIPNQQMKHLFESWGQEVFFSLY